MNKYWIILAILLAPLASKAATGQGGGNASLTQVTNVATNSIVVAAGTGGISVAAASANGKTTFTVSDDDAGSGGSFNSATNTYNLPGASSTVTLYGTNKHWRNFQTSNETFAVSGLLSNTFYRVLWTNDASTITWNGTIRWWDGETMAQAPSLQGGSYILDFWVDLHGTNATVITGPGPVLVSGNLLVRNGDVYVASTNVWLNVTNQNFLLSNSSVSVTVRGGATPKFAIEDNDGVTNEVLQSGTSIHGAETYQLVVRRDLSFSFRHDFKTNAILPGISNAFNVGSDLFPYQSNIVHNVKAKENVSVGGNVYYTTQIPAIASSNIVWSFNTNRYEIVGLTNLVFTNLVELASGQSTDLSAFVHNTTGVTMGIVWPAHGAQHGYYFSTNANNDVRAVTSLASGGRGVASFTITGTNIQATWTGW